MTPLTVHPAIRASVSSGSTVEVVLPLGVEYFTISETAGTGQIRWGVTQAYAEHATQYHAVAASTTSGVIAAGPRSIWIKAQGGNVSYYIFAVRAGD